MESAILEQIAPYFAHGLKYINKYFIYDATLISVEKQDVFIEVSDPLLTAGGWASFYETKPILRPMDLTKPIIVEGKEVIPIVELAKITHINENHKSKYINSCYGTNSGIKYSFCYYKGSFEVKQRIGKSWVYKPCFNQLELFQWLFKHKFDIHGLIEKGLAIDVSTLKINPYE